MFGQYQFATVQYAGILISSDLSTLEESLKDFLTATIDLNPHYRPQTITTFPSLTYQRISTPRVHNLDGAAGLAKGRVQLDVWSHSLSEATQMASAIRGVLHGYSGPMGGIIVTVASLEREFVLYESPTDATDLGIHHILLDYRINYRETIPAFDYIDGTTESGAAIEASLYTYLTTIVSVDIYPGHVPQTGNMPSVVYSKSNHNYGINLDGANDWSVAGFRLEVFASTYKECSELVEQLRVGLDGFRGMMTDVLVHVVTVDNETSNYTPDQAKDSGRFSLSMDISIFFRLPTT
jgi:hypothetical protein